MKKIISFLILTIFLGNTGIVNADAMVYSKQVRAKIMDQFKDQQYKQIYKNDNVFLAEENLNFFETDKKIELLNELRNKNNEKKLELESEKSVLDTRVYNLENTIAQLDEEISQNTQQMNALSIEIATLNSDITNLKIEIDSLQEQIRENRDMLLQYLGHIYKKTNVNTTNEEEIDTLKTILLNSKDLSEILSEIHYSSIMEVAGQTLVEKHKKLVKQHFFKKIDLQNAMQRSMQAKKEELMKRKIILEKREFRQKILDFTKGKQEAYEEFIQTKTTFDQKLKIKILQNKLIQKEQKQQILKKYNCEYVNIDNYGTKKEFFVEEQNQSMDCITLNKVLDAEAQLTSFSVGKQNPLSWPVQPENGLSAYFRDKSYENYVGTTHDAIDIRADQGTDIMAPADGYVTFVRAPYDEGYAYVVLKHADGFVTVYGHVNEVLVEQYDFVKAGTVFARTGGEMGTKGAGYMTTGPHLHFEVYKDKEYVDPLDFLDLTILGEEKLPNSQKFVYKYMQDFQLKNGVEYSGALKDKVKIFKLEGKTEEERQKYLLANYATPSFNNWDLWVEESIAAKLDPSFLMCIGLSETGLGRNLKTAYNVGNIGNTDDGGTREFDTPRQGVYWMGKTLNNKFLGDYKEMSKLSRYGNTSGAIYASSPLNWQNNMVRCLSALKQTYIPDNYKFRIEE